MQRRICSRRRQLLASLAGIAAIGGYACRPRPLVAPAMRSLVAEFKLQNEVDPGASTIEIESGLGRLGVHRAGRMVAVQRWDGERQRSFATGYLVPLLVQQAGILEELQRLQTPGRRNLANVRDVLVHANPRLVFPDRTDATGCQSSVTLEGEDTLRAVVCENQPCPAWQGAGVAIAVVDEEFNVDYVKKRHPGVEILPQFGLIAGKVGALGDGKGDVGTHGTMCAYLATVFAPDAKLIEFASAGLPDSRAIGAFEAYQTLGLDIANKRLPVTNGVVVTNSWELEETTEPIAAICDSPEFGVISAAQPCHFLNRAIEDLAKVKADIVFAAGDRGRCASFQASVASAQIRGANAHPDVLTVTAVDWKRRRIGNSSQGPGLNGTVWNDKPDASAYSNYSVSYRLEGIDDDVDKDTSAATALAAGMVAAVRSAVGWSHSPAVVRCLLLEHARRTGLYRAQETNPIDIQHFDSDFGRGVLKFDGWDPQEDLNNGLCTSVH